MNSKKILFSSFCFIVVFSISTFSAPFSAFASENFGSPNKFGVIPYNENMLIKSRDVYSNDYSNPEYIQRQLDNGFVNYDGKFDAKKNLGGILCYDSQAQSFQEAYNFSAVQMSIISKACDSWKNHKNGILVYQRYNSDSYYSTANFIFYTGSKKINLKYGNLQDEYSSPYNGFFAELSPEDYNDLYIISAAIRSPYYACAGVEPVGICSANSIDVQISPANFQSPSVKIKSPNENYHFLFGSYGSYYTTPVFSNFAIEYPAEYPAEDKIAEINKITTPKIREVYHPYFWFSVKNKNLNGMIQSFFDSGKNVGSDGASGRIKPFFELYDEKRQNKIFEYSGTNLADNFNYDFENYGTYYVKTFVQWDFPAPLAPAGRPEIIQPVWTEITINGSTYAHMANPQNPKTCDENNVCSLPDYVESCSLIKDDVGLRFACEFQRLDKSFRNQFGILMLPLDITAHTIQNFQTKTNISCSISNGPLKIDACVFERKFPALYTFLNMAANGVIIFAFVLFLRNSLVGFLNSKGDE